MDREEALKLLKEKVKNKNLRKHMFATEVVMEKLAEYFSEDKKTWGLAGLLHDLDYDETINNFSRHGYLTSEMLEEFNLPHEIIYAIQAHPGHVERKSRLDKALYAVDPVTGLIVAGALIHPDKKLGSIDAKFIINRFGEKRFAAGANREQIKSCEEIGLDLEKFIQLSLSAMQDISDELGL